MFQEILKVRLFNKTTFLLFSCAFFLFIGRWFFSYYFFDENIAIKIILESHSDGYFYFPFVKYLSLLDFNNSYDPNIDNLKNIPFPLYGVLFHSIFFKLFGIFSFIILELICIFLFLIIFFSIFQKFNLPKLISIVLSISLFLIPTFLELLNLQNMNYLASLSQFYNLRFQSPIVVNLFLFYFILFLFDLNNKKIFEIKNFVVLAFILAFSFTSFYYHFLIEILSFLFFLIYKLNFNINSLFRNKIKYYLISIIIFLILSFPFILNMFFIEIDYGDRIGIMKLTMERKMILISHLLEGLFKFIFLILFILISFLTYFVNKSKFENYQLNNILYIIFLSSVLSPFIFIFFSPQLSLVYHFTDLIKILAFLCLFFLIVNILKNYFCKYFNSKKGVSSISILIILFLITFFNINTYLSYKYKFNNDEYKIYRSYLSSLTNQIQNLKFRHKDLSLLTMDSRIMVWAIMNNINDIKLISGLLVPKKHSMIEDDLISTFKFLNKTENEFINFFENKRRGWRYLNLNTQLFFTYRYSANSLKTYNESREFKNETLDFILNTSPLYAQSLVIPDNEFERLRSKFKNFNEINFKKPSIISINNVNITLEDLEVLNKNYCLDDTHSPFYIYKLKDEISKC